MLSSYLASNSEKYVAKLKHNKVRCSDYTRDLIIKQLNSDVEDEVTTIFLKVSLACPLGKIRMRVPCQTPTCSHLQCFDGLYFMLANANHSKSTWSCPVCEEPAHPDDLIIDAYFQGILNSEKLPPDSNEIQLLPDGSWKNLVDKGNAVITPRERLKTIDLDCNEVYLLHDSSPKNDAQKDNAVIKVSKRLKTIDIVD